MTGLMVKDFLVMRKSIKTYILFLAFYFVMAALGIFPISFITAMVQIIIMMLPLSAFSYDEMSKWDRYAFSLPLGRRAYFYLVIFLPIILLVAASKLGMLDGLSFLEQIPEATAIAFALLLPLLPLLGMVASYLISCRILERKEF